MRRFDFFDCCTLNCASRFHPFHVKLWTSSSYITSRIKSEEMGEIKINEQKLINFTRYELLNFTRNFLFTTFFISDVSKSFSCMVKIGLTFSLRLSHLKWNHRIYFCGECQRLCVKWERMRNEMWDFLIKTTSHELVIFLFVLSKIWL